MESIIVYSINTIIGALVGWLVKRHRDSVEEQDQLKADNAVLKQGFQALLRAQMVKDYNRYQEKGFMPIYAKDNFENVYQAYHRMGSNGVMDDIYSKVMAMPTEPVNDK